MKKPLCLLVASAMIVFKAMTVLYIGLFAELAERYSRRNMTILACVYLALAGLLPLKPRLLRFPVGIWFAVSGLMMYPQLTRPGIAPKEFAFGMAFVILCPWLGYSLLFSSKMKTYLSLQPAPNQSTQRPADTLSPLN